MISSAAEFIKLRISDNSEEYRRTVSEEISEAVCIELIEKHPEMKIWVIGNKTVPLSILNILSNDNDSNIRFSIALKRKLSHELFEKLSMDNDESVRQCIASNKKTPIDILEKLALDVEDMVKEVAIERLDELANSKK